MPNIILGYPCVNITLKEEENVVVDKNVKLQTFINKGPIEGKKFAKEMAMNNLINTKKVVEWNIKNGIKFYRISSDIFPHFTNPKKGFKYSLNFASEILKEIGVLINESGMRVSAHPGQFCQLGTTTKSVFKQTYKELKMHAKMFDMMDVKNAVIIIHGGGKFGDLQKTLKRIEKRIGILPEYIKNKISFENDEFTYGVPDLLPLCEKTNIPFCFDYFHHSIKQDMEITDKIMKRIIKTWTNRDMIPKFHLSEQMPASKKGKHGDYVKEIPDIFLEYTDKYKLDLYIMIEAKKKELALYKLFDKYFTKKTKNGIISYKYNNKS